jgi:hypothetical protein
MSEPEGEPVARKPGSNELTPEKSAEVLRRFRRMGRQRKYRNHPTVVDGHRFDSKKEAEYYTNLKAFRAAGKVEYFLRQVPFELPGRTTYRADFMILWANRSRPDFVDVKGTRTETYKLKKRQVEEIYGVRIREV